MGVKRIREKLQDYAVIDGRGASEDAEILSRIYQRDQDHGAAARARALAPTFLLVSLGDELADRLIGLGQRRLVGQKHNAEVPGAGFLPKAGAVDHEHVLCPAEFLDENVVAFLDVDAGKGVERATGRNTAQARR